MSCFNQILNNGFFDRNYRLIVQHVIFETLRHDPLFNQPTLTPTLHEQRETNYRRWQRISEYNFADPDDVGICMIFQ
jgi:hypothetical protein